MEIKKHIPNAITSANLFCGCMAISFISQGNLVIAAWLVIFAAVLDFFDGMAARLLNVNSETGKQLDSLADMVSFGVVPGFMMFKFLEATQVCDNPENLCWRALIIPYYGFLIPVFSALRLAKFNIDPRQNDSFIGVPTPANSLFIISLALVNPNGLYMPILSNHYALIGIILILCYLMTAELPLLALKFKNFSWKDNKWRWSVIGLSLLALVLFRWEGIAMVIILYILVSLIHNRMVKG